MKHPWTWLWVVVLGCEQGAGPDKPAPGSGSQPVQLAAKDPDAPAGDPKAPDPDAPGKKEIQPVTAAEKAPAESARLAKLPPVEKLTERTRGYFTGHVGRRIYVQVDKPLYKPGESIWIKSWDLRARDLKAEGGGSTRYELVSPKGAVVLRKQVQSENGLATNDFEVPEGVQGGEYFIRVTAMDGVTGERPVIVSSYEAPRVKKKLEFVRKAYGAGDEVTATIEVKRPTGEPLANHPLDAVVRLDGQDLPRVKLSTNAEGGGLVRFTLPAEIERGDGLLTVLVEDGGVTESVSKRVPIILKKVQLSFFPEGGQLLSGKPGRVYFEAKNPIGKPADVEGEVVDDHGNVAAKFTSYHDGLGRLELTPSTGRRYEARITRPVGVTERYPLPLATEEGCTLRSYDDLDGQEAALRVAVRCHDKRTVVVVGMLRENLLDAAAVEVPADGEAVVHLKAADAPLAQAQGAARVTVFDDQLNPLAERLVYRNRRNGLQVKIEPDQKSYTPREQVALKVTTQDAAGQPVPAELALSVVDDTVVSFADDKTGHMLSKLFLEPEIPEKVEEPNVYFDLTEKKSALAMDLLMGTRGWRRFEWAPVLADPLPQGTGLGMIGTGMGGGGRDNGLGLEANKPGRVVLMQRQLELDGVPEEEEKGAVDLARAAPAKEVAEAPKAEPPPVEVPPQGQPVAAGEQAPPEAKAAEARAEARPAVPMPPADEPAAIAAGAPARPMPMGGLVAADAEAEDMDWKAGKKKMANLAEPVAMAPVRVFPAPTYGGDYAGPRTDFRETIHWAPTVRTSKDGTATVTFYLSDAVTSFRVFAEGAGGGLAGRHEEVLESSLPFSLNVKLPVEVSAGDKLRLPLTLTNETDKEVGVSLTASFGTLLKLDQEVSLKSPKLGAGQRETLYYPVTVTGVQGQSEVKFAAEAGGLKDEFVRQVAVVPVGFPQELVQSGTLKDKASATFDLGAATPGSVQAAIKLYPSPVATLTSGLDGLLREPSGCFEQTSSTNYPNVMVMQYLKTSDIADPALIAKSSGLIDRGYQKLVSFETDKKGYEWFGKAPAHEALTAYGLLEFVDMKRIYGGVDDAMLARTAAWLKTRRDGKGGFLRDAQALDSFGRAGPEVTDAYIMYALSEAGLTADFQPEVEAQVKRAQDAKDPYVLALAANSLLNLDSHKATGMAAAKRLVAMQKDDGGFPGADHSITRSGGINLDIETTALAVLALMKANEHADGVRKGIEWLNKNRGGFGEWGATQSTVLALKTMTEYAIASRKTQGSGVVTLFINGAQVGQVPYEAGRREPIDFHDLGAHFKPGPNTVELTNSSAGGAAATEPDALPFSMGVEFRSVKPATHPEVVVDLATRLERDQVKMGENVRLVATLKNKTDQGQPMTLARVGLPGGLSFQTWQLKELRDKGLVAQYETRPREVILYFRDLKPSAVHEIPLDLVATTPGDFTGPASSAYLYYTDDRKFWTDGLKASINQ